MIFTIPQSTLTSVTFSPIKLASSVLASLVALSSKQREYRVQVASPEFVHSCSYATVIYLGYATFVTRSNCNLRVNIFERNFQDRRLLVLVSVSMDFVIKYVKKENKKKKTNEPTNKQTNIMYFKRRRCSEIRVKVNTSSTKF